MRQSLLNKTLLALTLAGALAANVHAQGLPFGELSGTGQVAYESQYVFRGKKISNSSLQPKGEIGMQVGSSGSAYIGAWSNQPVSRRTGAGGPDQSNEIDLFGGFMYSLPFLSGLKVDIGDIYYWYPEAGGQSIPGVGGTSSRVTRSNEVYVGFNYVMPKMSLTGDTVLKPSVYFYHDLMLDSNTVEVAVTTLWDLTPVTGISGLSLTPTILGGMTHANRTWGDQFNSGIPGNPHANWRNGYLYWKAGFELDYKLGQSSCYLFGELNYEGNNDGKTGGFLGGNPQLGGTPNSVWFGAGLKFRQ